MQRGLIFINKSSLLFILFLLGAAITTPPSLFASTAAAAPTTKSVSPPKSLSTKSSWPKKPSFILSSSHRCSYLFYSPDGKLLAASSRSGAVSVWRAATGRFLKTLPISGEIKEHPEIGRMGNPRLEERFWEEGTNLKSMAISPDDKIIASGNWRGEIKLWDISTGKFLKTLGKHRKIVNCVAFSPDGKLLASGSTDKTINIWDLLTGRCLRSLSNLPELKKVRPDISSRINSPEIGPIYLLAFSPDGRLLASAGGLNLLVIWEVKTGKIFSSLGATGSMPWSPFHFSADGEKLIASPGSPADIFIYDIRTRDIAGKFASRPLNSPFLLISGDIAPNLRIAANITPDTKKINLWDLKGNILLHYFPSQRKNKSYITLAFSPDGHSLAVARSDNKIELWPIPKEYWPTQP
jgi:WD40 repeat protein